MADLFTKCVITRFIESQCIQGFYPMLITDGADVLATLIYTYLQAQIIPECTYERKQLVYVMHLVNKGCSFRKVFLRVCIDFKA